MKLPNCLLRGREICNLSALSLLAAIRYSLLALLARMALAMSFWVSGRAIGYDGMAITPSSYTHAHASLSLMPDLAAPLLSYAEYVLLALLILGLFTRLSAIALLCMPLLSQLFLFPAAWPSHLSSAILLLLLIGRGAGRISLDHALGLH